MGKVIAVCMGNVFTDKILNSSLPFLVLAAASLITFGCAQSNGKRLGKTGIFCIRMVRVFTHSHGKRKYSYIRMVKVFTLSYGICAFVW